MNSKPSAESRGAADEHMQRAASWTSYWRGGALHSCAGSFSGNYDGALRQFWLGQFDQLQPPSTVVDMCCGNAPLSLMLISERAARLGSGRVEAVDLAQIEPPWLAALDGGQRARIRVHAGVSAAALPLADASVDLVMSQFGVEYVGLPAICEARRVLRPGGSMAAVVHHVDALPVTVGRTELAHLRTVAELDLLELAQQMLEPMARSASEEGRRQLAGDEQARRLRAAFNDAMTRLSTAIEQEPHPDLLHEVRDGLMRALQQAQQAGAAAGLQALQVLAQAIEDSRLRQRELVEHALTREGIAAWASTLGAVDASIETIELRPGALAGWAVSFRRSQ